MTLYEYTRGRWVVEGSWTKKTTRDLPFTRIYTCLASAAKSESTAAGGRAREDSSFPEHESSQNPSGRGLSWPISARRYDERMLNCPIIVQGEA